MIYLNNAQTTVEKPEGAKGDRKAGLEEAKAAAAQVFGMKDQGEVLLTKGCTQAMEIVLKSLLSEENHVISTVTEQDGVLKLLENIGCQVSYVGVNAYGALKYEDIEPLIKPNTKAVVICHGSPVTGNVVDMEKISVIAKRHGLLVIADGAQTAGGIDFSFENLGADFYCFTAHKKLMGPYGLGGVCMKEGMSKLLNKELVEGIGEIDEGLLGKFCAGIEYILGRGMYGVAMQPHRMAKRFFEAVSSMDAVKVYGDFGTGIKLPIVSLSVEGHKPSEVAEFMKKNGIVVKAGTCDCSMLHKALGTEEGLVRFSFGYFNTRQDVNDAIWILMKMLGVEDLYLLA